MLRQPTLRQLARRTRAHGPVSLQTPGRRTFARSSRPSASSSGRPVEGLNIRRMAEKRADYDRTRRSFLVSGALAGCISFVFTAWKLKEALEAKPTKMDSTLPPTDPLIVGSVDAQRKVVVHDNQGREIVPTGNSTVPNLPRTLDLPNSIISLDGASSADSAAAATAGATTEYTLVGFGIRTVTFLGIQVYMVGYYIATADVAALQAALVRSAVDAPVATTLVPSERDRLRERLLDPVAGEELWTDLLRRGIPARSVFRLVPVRDTDFPHLRDGLVRAIQARGAQLEKETPLEGGGRDFGKAMADFRQLFNRGRVPRRRELLMLRDAQGKLGVAFDEGKGAGLELVGPPVEDERVSRALWLNYLAGAKVASPPARESIVNGIMEFVERPVGTVATQVV